MLTMIASLAIVSSVSLGAPVTFRFETPSDVEGWMATGPSAAAQITQEPQNVREGQGALLCRYTGQPGQPFSLSRAELDLAGARSLSASLKASTQAPLVLTLTEGDGSLYHTFVTCVAGQWCDVAVPLNDFQLQDGSEDENNALDPDQVTTFTIQELANMPGELGDIFGIKTGEQTLIVDELAFGAAKVASRSETTRTKVMVDSFEGSTPSVLAVGGARLVQVPGHEGKETSALGIDFTFAPAGARAWPGIVLPIGHLDLAGVTVLRLRLKALDPLRLHVLLEEQDGSRYEISSSIVGGDQWQAKDFRLEAFRLDPSRQDENALLDADQLRVLIIVADVYNALLNEKAGSFFAIDDVLFLKQ